MAILSDVFYFLLSMSITAAIIIAVLLAARAALRERVSKLFIYPLWGIALFRLLVPVSLQSRFSLINLVSGYIARTVTVPQSAHTMPDVAYVNMIRAASSYFPVEYKSEAVEHFFMSSAAVWICGTVIFLIISILAYSLAVSRLREAQIIRDEELVKACSQRLNIKGSIKLYESSLVSTPVVLGIIRPRIIIPPGIPAQDLEYALLHELSHIKACDSLWKVTAVFAACLHWFNPFAWLLLYMLRQDMELACDERVLKVIPDRDRRNYASALVSLAQRQNSILTAFGNTAVRMRILNIAGYKRTPLIMTVSSGIVCIILVIVLATNPIL
jgi:beta-lactamase regulating signal transducer with metallopeptidase domain